MIEIVEKPLNEITCGQCECRFRFEEEDVQYAEQYSRTDWIYEFGLKNGTFYIACPCCGGMLFKVKEVMDKSQYKHLCEKFGNSSLR